MKKTQICFSLQWNVGPKPGPCETLEASKTLAVNIETGLTGVPHKGMTVAGDFSSFLKQKSKSKGKIAVRCLLRYVFAFWHNPTKKLHKSTSQSLSFPATHIPPSISSLRLAHPQNSLFFSPLALRSGRSCMGSSLHHALFLQVHLRTE